MVTTQKIWQMKHILLLGMLILAVTACSSGRPAAPVQMQKVAARAWQASRHAVWEISWPNVPLHGQVTAEVWRADHRLRVEILEAAAPTLLGQTLVVNGERAWQFNRFESPDRISAGWPVLSPVTDAFAQIEQRLADTPATATTSETVVNSSAAQKIDLYFDGGDSVTFVLDVKTGLPLQVDFTAGNQTGKLRARSIAPLPDPPPELFLVN